MNYEHIPAVRRSELWEIRKSPLHYLYAVNNPPESTPALEFGTAAHKYILEQDDFWNDFAISPVVDRRTKEGKARWLQFQDMLEETGKKSVSMDDLEAIKQMDESILRNPTATALLKTGIHETPITWVDGETGELCKCRPDCITVFNGSKYIVDYKTTTSCEDGHFERACRQYGYKLQAAMYTEGMFNQEFENYGFAFVAQEKKPPFAVRVYFCDRGFIEEGIEVFRTLIGRYHKCRVSGEWPGYEDKELLGDE